MKITQLQGVQFKVEAQADGGAVLSFTLSVPVGPDRAVVTEIVAIPFDAQAWQNFKRQVESDGEIKAIDIARTVPTMAIPGQR